MRIYGKRLLLVLLLVQWTAILFMGFLGVSQAWADDNAAVKKGDPGRDGDENGGGKEVHTSAGGGVWRPQARFDTNRAQKTFAQKSPAQSGNDAGFGDSRWTAGSRHHHRSDRRQCYFGSQPPAGGQSFNF